MGRVVLPKPGRAPGVASQEGAPLSALNFQLSASSFPTLLWGSGGEDSRLRIDGVSISRFQLSETDGG